MKKLFKKNRTLSQMEKIINNNKQMNKFRQMKK